MLPLVPVIVMVRVARVALRDVLMVMMELPDPVMEVGLKEMVVPLASPDAERLMDELKPLIAKVETVTLPDELLPMLSDVGEAEMLKVAAALVTVSETLVDAFTPPPVPLMPML